MYHAPAKQFFTGMGARDRVCERARARLCVVHTVCARSQSSEAFDRGAKRGETTVDAISASHVRVCVCVVRAYACA